MALNRVKAFTLKNGEFLGDITCWQSGYAGGMPAGINSASAVVRAYSETGYIGIFAKGSAGTDADASGAAVTFYSGPGIFTMEKQPLEADYPYDESLTYVAGQNFGILAGQWVNSGYATIRGRVLAVGAVSGGSTTSLTLLFV